MASEQIFLDSSDTYVSNTKVILAGTTYATANITSVSKHFTPASRGCAVLLILIGGLMTFGSLGAVFSKDAGSGIVMFLICAALTAAAVAWFRSLKPTFHVVLASASGERRGLSSKDQDYIDEVIHAITNAITHRG